MNGKQIAVILALIGAAAVLLGQQQTSKVSEFESWKAKHGVNYASQFENAYRERVFLENLAKIRLTMLRTPTPTKWDSISSLP